MVAWLNPPLSKAIDAGNRPDHRWMSRSPSWTVTVRPRSDKRTRPDVAMTHPRLSPGLARRAARPFPPLAALTCARVLREVRCHPSSKGALTWWLSNQQRDCRLPVAATKMPQETLPHMWLALTSSPETDSATSSDTSSDGRTSPVGKGARARSPEARVEDSPPLKRPKPLSKLTLGKPKLATVGRPPCPPQCEGGWRGGRGFEMIQTFLKDKTRFELAESVQTRERWSLYWSCMTLKAAASRAAPGEPHVPLPNRLPLRCTECGEETTSSTLENFLNTRASARCGCNTKRVHAMLENRDDLVERYEPAGWEPEVSAEDWVEHHRVRSAAWHTVRFRCMHGCGSIKEVPAAAIFRAKVRAPCLCSVSLLKHKGLPLLADTPSYLAARRMVSDVGMTLTSPSSADAWCRAMDLHEKTNTYPARIRLTVVCNGEGCHKAHGGTLQELRRMWRRGQPVCDCQHAKRALAEDDDDDGYASLED